MIPPALYHGPGSPLQSAAARGAAKARKMAGLRPSELRQAAITSESTVPEQAAYIGAYLAADGALVRTDHATTGQPFTKLQDERFNG